MEQTFYSKVSHSWLLSLVSKTMQLKICEDEERVKTEYELGVEYIAHIILKKTRYEGLNFMYLAQGRNQWQTFLSALMNI